MTKRPASLSLDLDNHWSYLKTRGDPAWEAYPSYLDVVVPRALELLDRHGLRITFFIVGQDAARPENGEALASIAPAGHEIGNHSHHHEPWLHRYSPAQVREELSVAHEAISKATGVRPRGFRGPGYSVSAATLETLVDLGYQYDASTLPTFIGPVARAFYFRASGLDDEERRRARGPLRTLERRPPSRNPLPLARGGEEPGGGAGDHHPIPAASVPLLLPALHR